MGPKTAVTLLKFAQGEDERVLCVEAEVQSISTQVSYGVRCAEKKDVAEYMKSVCKVGERGESDEQMLIAKTTERALGGRKLVLKIYKRKANQITVRARHDVHE